MQCYKCNAVKATKEMYHDHYRMMRICNDCVGDEIKAKVIEKKARQVAFRLKFNKFVGVA